MVLRAEDRGGFPPSGVQQFQNVMLFSLHRLRQQLFVNDEQDQIGILREYFPVVVLTAVNLQLQ